MEEYLNAIHKYTCGLHMSDPIYYRYSTGNYSLPFEKNERLVEYASGHERYVQKYFTNHLEGLGF